MSGPHRNHVEMRAKKIAARQYVSETHDHKPDAPTRVGTSRTRSEFHRNAMDCCRAVNATHQSNPVFKMSER